MTVGPVSIFLPDVSLVVKQLRKNIEAEIRWPGIPLRNKISMNYNQQNLYSWLQRRKVILLSILVKSCQTI